MKISDVFDDVTAMQWAIRQAEQVKGTTYPNPPVGAVILDTNGNLVGLGATKPTGGDHAEIVALAQAGTRAHGGTAVVTLEPCHHHGRTPPCTDALIAAGLHKVIYAIDDPNPCARGGGKYLASQGISVLSGVLAEQVRSGVLREWLHKQHYGRPHVTWKYAASLDGRIAAADKTSRWISSYASRVDVHQRRQQAEAIIIGTGTVIVDNPTLTARLEDGTLASHQPLRVVVGKRPISLDSNILNDDAHTMLIHTHDPHEVLSMLNIYTDIILEGGPTLASVFLQAGLIDRILAYIAPKLVGGPFNVITDIGVDTLTHALQWRYDDITTLDQDLRLSLIPLDRPLS